MFKIDLPPESGRWESTVTTETPVCGNCAAKDKRLAEAERLLNCVKDCHYAAGMCDRTSDIYHELGQHVSRLIPGIKAFLEEQGRDSAP